jgi:hypothetical protein
LMNHRLRNCILAAAKGALLHLSILAGIHSAHAQSVEACIRDFENPYNVISTASSPLDYRDACLQVLAASERTDAAYVAGRIQIANGELKAARELLDYAAEHGNTEAALSLLALEMARFEDRYPLGWRSSESPAGLDAKYTLDYTAVVRAARRFEEQRAKHPIIDDFTSRYDPASEKRSSALRSLLEQAGNGLAYGLIAQQLIGRQLHDGSIPPSVLKEKRVVAALNRLLAEPSNSELMWWVGCAGRLSYIYDAADVRVLGELLAESEPRSVLESAIASADVNGLAAKTTWRFRRALFNLEDSNRSATELADEVSDLKVLSSLGHRSATRYLDASAVGEVIGAYSMSGFGLATDQCQQQTRIVFDQIAALAWWSKRIEAEDCNAIGDIIRSREWLKAKGSDRELPKTSDEPLRLLMKCRSPIDSRYLEIE